MAFVKSSGERAEVEGRIKLDADGGERLRDMIMVVMDQKGYTQRAIGLMLGCNNVTVSRRLAAIPPNVRKYLESQGREFFGGLFDEEKPDVIVSARDYSKAVDASRADLDDSPETIERLVDVLAVALHDLGLSPRRVGYVVGLSESETHRRILEVPDAVKTLALAARDQLW